MSASENRGRWKRILVIVGVITFFILLSGSEPAQSMGFAGISEKKKDSSKILKEIYREVKELGKYPGDDFIKREFFVGKDDDDTYKDIHVLIMIQDIDEKEKITIQVTYFQSSKDNPIVKYAKKMRNILYFLVENRIHIIERDYDEKESASFLKEVLRAIKDKKKILKKFDH